MVIISSQTVTMSFDLYVGLMGTALKHFEGWISSLSYDGQFLVAFNNIGADFSTIVYDVEQERKCNPFQWGTHLLQG